MQTHSSQQSIVAIEETHEIVLKVDATVYSRDALLRVMYWFSKDYYCELASESEAHFSVRLQLKPAALESPKAPNLKAVVSEFQNALIDAELRVEIQKQTTGIRELILAKAFSEAGVLEDTPPHCYEDPVLASKPNRLTANVLKILS